MTANIQHSKLSIWARRNRYEVCQPNQSLIVLELKTKSLRGDIFDITTNKDMKQTNLDKG